METKKAYWVNDNEHTRLVMPFSKVDQEHRTVSGFASLNNIDKSGDVVTASASENAFRSFRGNIREMHQPIAAGKLISFSQEPYYDAASGETYLGIFVTVYVSKGAQDTWEKVVDGTLSGFSIGGMIEEQHTEYVPELNKSIRFITSISLIELSLVDNPANQFANVLSISKVDGEVVVKGMIADTETQNVFWCETDQSAVAVDSESASCLQCSEEMQNIGWIEVTDYASTAEELKKFVDEWTHKVITAKQIKEQLGKETVSQQTEFANEEKVVDNNDEAVKSEGGVSMSDVETVEKAAEIEEVVEAVEEPVEKAEEVVETPEEAVSEETVEKAEDAEDSVDEVESVEKTEEYDFSKAVEDIKNFVTEAVQKSSAEQNTSVEKISKAVEELEKSVAPLMEAVKEVGGRLERLESATAVKKSGNDEESEPVEKGFSWDGHFASVNTLTKN
jgi:hypothetical protein